MSKPIYFLPWAMRMVIILCLVITHIQQDSLVYILSAFTLILIVFCIWGCSKSKTQNILKALTGNRTQNIFDVVMSALFIIIGLYCKDTTTVIEGGALLTISVINIISPIKYQKSGSSVNSIDSQQNEINPHKRNDYPQLDGFIKGNKLHDKCNQVRCLSVLYKQIISYQPNQAIWSNWANQANNLLFCHNFSHHDFEYMLFQLLKDAQLTCKRCPLSLLLTPF